MAETFFGTVVRQRRGRRSLRQFEDDTGISKATLCRIERGRDPDIRTFFYLCRVLKLAPQAFDEDFRRE